MSNLAISTHAYCSVVQYQSAGCQVFWAMVNRPGYILGYGKSTGRSLGEIGEHNSNPGRYRYVSLHTLC